MLSPHILTTNDLLIFTGLFISSAIIALGSTYYLIGKFNKWHILANSNARSMHDTTVPIGGGWAIFPLALFAWMVFSWPIEDKLVWVIFSSTILLAILSWVDDRQHLNQLVRLSVQIIAITTVLILLPDDKTVFSSNLPLWADRILTGLSWLWFVNLFNFMDGIDGLAGIEILFICAGFIFIGLEIGFEMPTLHVATVLAGATVGFLWWNWHPAKIFLGDVGSISIGFLLGWLLIQLAMDGYLIAALLLPAYFVTDASLTILKRIFNKEPFWKPHKKHYYQRAAMGLGNHVDALWKIIPANFGLLVFAITSIHQPLISALCGILVLIFLFIILERYAAK
ncbi:MAG: glycosyltransferase family 4 protein [bacterium]|nr:glycosyltransferase family 4 protein [bacterium]